MGVIVEFNPDLALRNYSEFESENRSESECIPKDLQEGGRYDFLKKGQRNYWLMGEVPLLETLGNQELSTPKASIVILECKHFVKDGVVWTSGKYEVIKVLNEKEVYFNGTSRAEQ